MTPPSLKFSRSSVLRCRLDCDLTEVRPATAGVGYFLREQGLSEKEIQECVLALAEACNNAIHYAREHLPVEIEVLCDTSRVELRVHDRTSGLDWPKQVELPDPEWECGRGLYLIQALMERTDYLRSSEGNCLVMQRSRSGGRAAPVFLELEEARRKLEESEQIIGDMAEELSFCYESLSAIFRCSTELGRTNNLEEFCQRLLTDLSQITSAEWFVLRVLAKKDSRLVVFTSSEPALQLVPISLPGNFLGNSVELEAALSRQDIWFDPHRPLESSDPLGAIKPGSIGLVHPFCLGESLIGTLTVGKSAGHPHFTAVHANVVHTFADFLAIQIVNARFQEELVNSRVVSRELEIAKNIQRSLLPKTLPTLSGCTVAGYCESARQVGGDFYDVLRVDPQALLLIIADVMGKGIPAAIFAAILRSLLRAVPEWTPDPGALLGRINRLLFDELSGVDMFITAQLVYVNTREERLTTASAGHCPLLLANREGKVSTIAPEGMPLGILPDATFANHTAALGPDSRVLLFTDGLTEARNAQEEFFGQERLVRWLQESVARSRTAEELKEALAHEIARFQSDATLHDDLTFLIMAR
jgi:serine phosphatase RsbU (regulator of sigma subunit)/anti-sigma regulatory factor (Ser/Thr protein kinase)